MSLSTSASLLRSLCIWQPLSSRNAQVCDEVSFAEGICSRLVSLEAMFWRSQETIYFCVPESAKELQRSGGIALKSHKRASLRAFGESQSLLYHEFTQ